MKYNTYIKLPVYVLDIKGFYPYISELVTQVLRFKQDDISHAKEIMSGFNPGSNNTMISIHIRLTDFAKHLKILWNMKYAPDEYFKRAMTYFHNKYTVRISSGLIMY